MPGPRIAVASCPQFPDPHDDWPLLRTALEEIGISARAAVWSDPGVDWPTFDLVVASGTWDNIHRAEAFLSWVGSVAATGVPVANSPATLRWNIDKRYLRDLESDGVTVVPTQWVEPGGDGDPLDASSLTLAGGEMVVKPSVSGGGFQTARYAPGEREAARRHIGNLVAAGRTAMVQPYQHAVDTEGEAGLIFLGGEYSHAIHKEPMIRPGAGPMEHLIDNQVVTGAPATGPQRDLARTALAAAERRHGPTTYARVDMVTGTDGAPALLELELLDPVLFLTTAPDAPGRLARVLAEALG